MIRPLRDLLYIIPLSDREKIGHIYVPEKAKQRVDQGIVKYRGPATTGEIRRGDHVFFSGYDGSEMVSEDDGTLYIIPESFILAVHQDGERLVLSRLEMNDLIKKAAGETNVIFASHSKVTSATDYMTEKLKYMLDNYVTSSLGF